MTFGFKILLIICLICLNISLQQDISQCSNYYDTNNQPLPSTLCNDIEFQCIITNLTGLIVNNSIINNYGLCINYIGYTIIISNNIDILNDSISIISTDILLDESNITILTAYDVVYTNVLTAITTISLNNSTLNLSNINFTAQNIVFNLQSTVYLNESNLTSSNLVLNWTQFFVQNCSIIVSNSTIINGCMLNSSNLNISVDSNSSIIYSSNLNITTFSVVSNSSLSINSSNIFFQNVSISAQNFTIQNSTINLINIIANINNLLQFIQSNFTCNSNILFNLYTISFFNSIINTDNTTIISNNFQINFTNFKHRFLYIYAINNFQLDNSNISSTYSACNTNCSCKDGQNNNGCYTDPTIYQFPIAWQSGNYSLENIIQLNSNFFANMFTFVIISNQVTISSSTMQSAIMAFYVYNMTLIKESKIKTDGLGCPSLIGYGCGYFDAQLNQLLACTGTGGSYGGLGGNSFPLSCQLLVSRPIYGNATFPIYTGSGGGAAIESNYSSGGGVIYVQSYNLKLQNLSSMTSDAATTMIGGGGGSGGSINIQSAFITGNGLISSQGGNGKSSGGGGRISIRFAYWNNSTFVQANSQSSNIQINVNSGSGCNSNLSCGGNGSIVSSVCIPGYYLLNDYLCSPCPSGTFKSVYGYGNCTNCNNQPENSQYINKIASTTLNQCNYTCLPKYKQSSQKTCVTSFVYFSQYVGGQNVIISIFMIMGTIIGYGLIICGNKVFYSKSLKKENHLMQTNIKQFSHKPHFQIEEIPYHSFRIYLSGTNTMDDPWHIESDGFKHLENKFFNSIFFHEYSTRINKIGTYNKYEKGILLFLKFYYFPLYIYMAEKIKQMKSKDLYKLIKRMKKDLYNIQQLTIKLNVKPKNSVACLEFFDYKKSVFDFFLETYFPFVIVLEKKLLGGYTLDFSDPFLKALISDRDNRLKNQEENYQPLSKYFQELNQLLINVPQKFDPLFSHLADSNRYNLQIYLFQSPDNVLNLHPKQKYMKERQLILIISEDKSKSKHFFIGTPLPQFRFQQMERLKWQLQRKIYYKQEKSFIKFKWHLKNKFKKNILIWYLLLVVMIEFIFETIIFYDVVNPNDINIYFVILYSVIFPAIEFISILMAIYWALKPIHLIGTYCVLFTLASSIKGLILAILSISLIIQDSNQVSQNQTPYYFFTIGNFIILIIMLQVQRLLLWCCRND